MSRVVLAAIIAVSLLATSGLQPAQASHDIGPDRVYFPQTGQYLQYSFLSYWRHNGGIHVFGYPLTSEFAQDGMTVQYFERAIFEWHPDNPAGHRVLLRRLGAEALNDRGLRDHPAFQGSNSGTGSGRFFPETGHSISNGFLNYWNNRGGLAVFGYPMSGEFIQNGLAVQYFERAIFEWHPNNPADWRVLQERLGAEAAERDGVNTSPHGHDPAVDVYHPNLWQVPVAPAPRRTPLPGAPSHQAKWIEVDLTNQMMRAWEYDRLVYSAVVATGRPVVPTLTGTFQIYRMLRYDNMAGWTPDRGSYNLPNVPYVMYYDRGYALHGTYWHQNFGTPQSAGCVNLTPGDAAWVYNWASIGTTIWIHGRTPGT
jgi:lipoprotein-anchoring transpeptidase ErfK/SrfK